MEIANEHWLHNHGLPEMHRSEFPLTFPLLLSRPSPLRVAERKESKEWRDKKSEKKIIIFKYNEIYSSN